MDANVETIEKNILNYITSLNDEEYLGAIVNSASAVLESAKLLQNTRSALKLKTMQIGAYSQ